MNEIVFEAKKRTVIGKQVKALRREGLLPAIIYGHNVASVPITLDYLYSNRVVPGISPSQLITVDIEGDKRTVLLREVQRDPVTWNYLHIDFVEVSMTERLRTAVSLGFQGESPAVVEQGGILVIALEEVLVECLPGDLPERIHVDISSLVEIGDSIVVGDLKVSDKVDVLNEPDEAVVLISAPMAEPVEGEEEGEELEISEADDEPEVIERGKKEEDY